MLQNNLWLVSKKAAVTALCPVVAIALSIGVMPAFGAAKAQHKDSNPALAQANSLAGHAHYKEAVEKYKEALKVQPNNPTAHHMYGRTLALMGLLPTAIEEYRQAVALGKTKDGELENDLGVALAANDEPAEAAKHLKKTTILNPKYIAAYNNLGVALSRLGDYVAAKDAFQISLKMQPTNPYIKKKLDDVMGKLSESKHFDFNAPTETAKKPADPAAPALPAATTPAVTAAPSATPPAQPAVKEPVKEVAKEAVPAPKKHAVEPVVSKQPVKEHAAEPVATKQPVKEVEKTAITPKKKDNPVSEAPPAVTTSAPPASTSTTTTEAPPAVTVSEPPPATVSGTTNPAGGKPPLSGITTSLDRITTITTKKTVVNSNKVETVNSTTSTSDEAGSSNTVTTGGAGGTVTTTTTTSVNGSAPVTTTVTTTTPPSTLPTVPTTVVPAVPAPPTAVPSVPVPTTVVPAVPAPPTLVPPATKDQSSTPATDSSAESKDECSDTTDKQ